MGLLTDPNSNRLFFEQTLKSWKNYLSVLCYVVGVIWLIFLTHEPYNGACYFSENALLPGLVEGQYDGEHSAKTFLEGLKSESDDHRSSIPHVWLMSQFRQLGLDTYYQNFTLNYPFGSKSSFQGGNVFAILRAARSPSVESLVLSAPYRPNQSVHSPTNYGIAMMLSMAKHFRKFPYWAKDLIFLITEHEQLGMQAWLQSYHKIDFSQGMLKTEDLQAHSGLIQAAINLELSSIAGDVVDIKFEGLNGQLPNLDLVHLVHRLCHQERIYHTHQNILDHPNPQSTNGWKHSFKTFLAMVQTQSTGIPNGNHGLFLRFGIQAVTINSAAEVKRAHYSDGHGFRKMGRVLEGIFRSLNNLLEKFHQSYFFYLMPATDRYISIGLYMIPFALIAAPYLIKALCLWFDIQGDLKPNSNVTSDTLNNNLSFFSFVPLVSLIHGMSIVPLLLLSNFDELGMGLGYKSNNSISFGLCIYHFGLVVFTSFLKNKEWRVLKCIALLEVALALFSVSVYNFSLALIVAVIYTLPFTFALPLKNRILQAIQAVTLVALHPVVLGFVFVLFNTHTSFPEREHLELMKSGVNAYINAVMYSIIDSIVYGNWLLSACHTLLIPVWHLMWISTSN